MIKTQKIYDPLYLDKDKFIYLVTGGRGSGKSFNVSTFLSRLSFTKGHKILFSRYTMSSAKDSVIPEFNQKIELDGFTDMFDVTQHDITNLISGSEIIFRGIKTSSGDQTAKLKSLQGLTVFVVDEGEEWTSEDEFEKLMLSIRKKGTHNRVVIIMNPTDENHFVYQRYIKNTHKLVDYDGAKVQISTHPDVLHIHTSYLDNLEHLSKEFIEIAERMKREDKERYDHIFMGRWVDVAKGAIFKKWEHVNTFPLGSRVALGLDFGYSNDPTACAMCSVKDNNLYIKELFYNKGMSSHDIAVELKKYGNPKVVADSADPRLIDEIASYGIDIHPVKKGAGSVEAGLNKMLSMNIKLVGDCPNILEEFKRYTWAKDKDNHWLNKPIDGHDHIIDGVRYYVLTEVLGGDYSKDNVQGVFF